MTRASRNVAIGLSSAFGLLLLCVLIRPAGLAANDGLSYFGGYKTTVIPYTLAFFLVAYFYWETAKILVVENSSKRHMTMAMRAMAVLLVGLVLTPHNLVDPIHTKIGTALFVLQLLLTIWFIAKVEFSWVNLGLGLLELFGGLVSFYYLPKPHGLLLQGQVIFQLAFGVLLFRILNRTIKA